MENVRNGVCCATKTCTKRLTWSKIEKIIRESMQTVFESIGYGGSEQTYHCALFNHLSTNKTLLECSHMRCSLHSETVAPIYSGGSNRVPCGLMRSDIVLQWMPTESRSTKKRKLTESKRCEKLAIELKATRAALSSAAALQLLCYMRSYKASRGILCNFIQRCDSLDSAMASLQNQSNKCLTFSKNGDTISVKNEKLKTYIDLKPEIDFYSVSLLERQHVNQNKTKKPKQSHGSNVLQDASMHTPSSGKSGLTPNEIKPSFL